MNLSILATLMYEVNDACGILMSLLSTCEAMEFHMYIALVGLDVD